MGEGSSSVSYMYGVKRVDDGQELFNIRPENIRRPSLTPHSPQSPSSRTSGGQRPETPKSSSSGESMSQNTAGVHSPGRASGDNGGVVRHGGTPSPMPGGHQHGISILLSSPSRRKPPQSGSPRKIASPTSKRREAPPLPPQQLNSPPVSQQQLDYICAPTCASLENKAAMPIRVGDGYHADTWDEWSGKKQAASNAQHSRLLKAFSGVLTG